MSGPFQGHRVWLNIHNCTRCLHQLARPCRAAGGAALTRRPSGVVFATRRVQDAKASQVVDYVEVELMGVDRMPQIRSAPLGVRPDHQTNAQTGPHIRMSRI